MIFVNTAEFDLGQAQPTMLSVHKWIRSLGIIPEQIYGIMPVMLSATRVFRLKFKSSQDYLDFMNTHEGVKVVTMGDTKLSVTIREAGTREKYVRILDAPFEITDEEIRRRLETYGKVTSVKKEKYVSLSPDEGYIPTLNGARKVRMTIKTPIPSVINIDGQRIQVKYQGQPSTCFKCNKPGHYGAQCQERRNVDFRFPGKWADPKPAALSTNPLPKEQGGDSTMTQTKATEKQILLRKEAVTIEEISAFNQDVEPESRNEPETSQQEEAEPLTILVNSAGGNFNDSITIAASQQTVQEETSAISDKGTGEVATDPFPFLFGTGTFDNSPFTRESHVENNPSAIPETSGASRDQQENDGEVMKDASHVLTTVDQEMDWQMINRKRKTKSFYRAAKISTSKADISQSTIETDNSHHDSTSD